MTGTEREWLEPDGLGGFASGSVGLIRTRRYHALLLAATTPPTGRMVLVNGFDAWLETASQRVALSSQRYQPGVISPDGASRIESFDVHPWPTWTFRIDPGTSVTQEILVPRGRPRVIVTWRLSSPSGAGARLSVRPLLSGRDYHALHHENAACELSRPERDDRAGAVLWRPYPGVPGIFSRTNGTYEPAFDWYRRFVYVLETERGLEDTEDLVTPGWLRWDLANEAVWVLDAENDLPIERADVRDLVRETRITERARRASFFSPLHRAADGYLVNRGAGRTIVAGYPWFTDWGRDTFVALRGLCVETGRLAEAALILETWSTSLSQGMLPNRFPDVGMTPEYNAVDASLWFVTAVRDLLDRAAVAGEALGSSRRASLLETVFAVLDGYSAGTRYGIHVDDDGLLAGGVAGTSLTWMDARVADRPVTSRIGKPVEVQALWIAALEFAGRFDKRWQTAATLAREAFAGRFWNDQRQCLYDVVDVDHVHGRIDPSVRPNQIFAIGGLGIVLLEGARARAVVDCVEQALLTPCGLRSLAPNDPGYAAHYLGTPAERDTRYHQGTAWPWLCAAFVDAWLTVRGRSPQAVTDAKRRFVDPLLARLQDAGLDHLSEVADGEPPFTPRGCPFQAWSLGELIRAVAMTKGEDSGQP